MANMVTEAAASLAPSRHFDPDVLAGWYVDLEEAIELAGQLDFAVFWLGSEVEGEWASPQGNTHLAAVLTRVNAPGVATRDQLAGVSLCYSMPPDFYGPMLIVAQGPAATFQVKRGGELEAMRAAGNVDSLPGPGGLIYAEFSPGAPARSPRRSQIRSADCSPIPCTVSCSSARGPRSTSVPDAWLS